MPTSLDYLKIARELADSEGPKSNAIFQALMQAHQNGKVEALARLAADVDRQVSGARDYLHVLMMQTPKAGD